MALRITVDIFSGRPNPVIEVDGPDADEVLRRLKPGRKLKGREAVEPQLILGYRGLIIEQTGAASGGLPDRFRYVHGNVFGARFSHRAEDENFEDFLAGNTGLLRRLSLGEGFPDLFRKEVERSQEAEAEHDEKAQRRQLHAATGRDRQRGEIVESLGVRCNLPAHTCLRFDGGHFRSHDDTAVLIRNHARYAARNARPRQRRAQQARDKCRRN